MSFADLVMWRLFKLVLSPVMQVIKLSWVNSFATRSEDEGVTKWYTHTTTNNTFNNQTLPISPDIVSCTSKTFLVFNRASKRLHSVSSETICYLVFYKNNNGTPLQWNPFGKKLEWIQNQWNGIVFNQRIDILFINGSFCNDFVYSKLPFQQNQFHYSLSLQSAFSAVFTNCQCSVLVCFLSQ